MSLSQQATFLILHLKHLHFKMLIAMSGPRTFLQSYAPVWAENWQDAFQPLKVQRNYLHLLDDIIIFGIPQGTENLEALVDSAPALAEVNILIHGILNSLLFSREP
ncbi:hypothetical protein ACJX0J_022964 [Zea mays]